jgi:hypothetical protein
MTVLTRSDWGSTLPPGGYVIEGALAEVYVHHFNSGIAPVRDVETGKARMRGAQQYHAVTQGWGDIGYSWCVDDVGNIYEGRGWWRTGAHTYGYNSKGYGICWLGDSNIATPSQPGLEAIAEVVRIGRAAGAIVAAPTIVAHKDRVPDTSCCGGPMYAQLDEIRRLVAGGQQPTKRGEDMAKAFVAPGDTLVLVAGNTYSKVTAPWPQAHKGLVDLQAAGMLDAHADGSLWKPISAEALAVLEEV